MNWSKKSGLAQIKIELKSRFYAKHETTAKIFLKIQAIPKVAVSEKTKHHGKIMQSVASWLHVTVVF